MKTTKETTKREDVKKYNLEKVSKGKAAAIF